MSTNDCSIVGVRSSLSGVRMAAAFSLGQIIIILLMLVSSPVVTVKSRACLLEQDSICYE